MPSLLSLLPVCVAVFGARITWFTREERGDASRSNCIFNLLELEVCLQALCSLSCYS